MESNEHKEEKEHTGTKVVEKQPESNKSVKKLPIFIRRTIPLIIFFGLLIAFGVKSCKTNRSRETNEKTTIENEREISRSGLYYVVKKYEISLNENWSKIYSFSENESASFNKATVPYCTINGNNYETCGNPRQDISSNYGERIEANQNFRFKSSTGKSGTIILKIWRKI